MIKLEIANEQATHVFDADLLQKAVRIVFQGEQIDQGDVSVAIVDDGAMRHLNLKYLQHDYATDVLSFLLSPGGENAPLEGEIIVSADTAAREAVRFGWNKTDELLLYLINGTLHLLGYEDASDAEREAMRAKERRYLAELGRQVSYEERPPVTSEAPVADFPGEGDSQS